MGTLFGQRTLSKYSKALHMLPGSAFTTFAFLRHEPGIDLDGTGFTRHEFFAGFDQKVLR